MNDNIKLIAILGNTPLDLQNHDGEIDFMFQAKYENAENFSFDNQTIYDFNDLKNIQEHILKIEEYRKKNNSDQIEASYQLIEHIDYFKYYLQNKFKRVIASINLDQFEPSNEDILFSLFAELGNVLFTNSEYCTVVYLPKKPTKKQQLALIELTKLIPNNKHMEAKIIQSAKKSRNVDPIIGNYEDILLQYLTLDKLEIEEKIGTNKNNVQK